MRTKRTKILSAGALLLMSGPGVPPPPEKTPSFREATQEVRDLRNPQVPDKTVEEYLDKLHFPPDGEGEVGGILQCEKCSSTVQLEISSELGSVNLTENDLASDGRIIGKIRDVDWNPFHRQKDLQLNWHGQTAYVWVAGKPGQNGLYDAAIVRINGSGKRQVIVQGAMWFCAHAGQSHPPGHARWHPANECARPTLPGKVRELNFHLTSWFPCDQGCCVFQDSPA